MIHFHADGVIGFAVRVADIIGETLERIINLGLGNGQFLRPRAAQKLIELGAFDRDLRLSFSQLRHKISALKLGEARSGAYPIPNLHVNAEHAPAP